MPAPKKAPAVKRGPGSDEDFTFETNDGKTIVVPSLAVAPRVKGVAMLRAQADKNPALGTLLMLEAAAGPKAMKLIEDLSDEECMEFIEQWGDHSGVGLGESKAS